ncbi:sensor histidine kinase [Mycolicibacterium arenosum]|uniref:ATP-binding protein n=1 Tax=Mycolicibacterium arenosum TaxID=2952157 RepID=A0ABT1M194_9MYCO|nr:ATP-binding protein [Mycolicibacterium sp. CAU 1645]MCP9272207.1 ATP-binding protein [Mycolicibacterium sp. CAU 1645]
MRRDGSAEPRAAGGFWASLVVPPVATGPAGSEAVRDIYVMFNRQAQRLRSILRLLLVGVMLMLVWSGTSRGEWPAQLTLITCYAALSVAAAWAVARHPQRAHRLRALEPMVPVDVAAICVLQFLSTGSYLVLGLLSFLPFFIATQAGRRAAVISVVAIVGGGSAVVADPVFRQQMSAPMVIALLTMLALLCLCSYTVSRVQQRRLAAIAELTASRSLLLADVMSAEERERRRIAETLHDGALQTVLAAKQDLREAIRNGGAADGVVRASELLGDVSRDLRQVTRELHPSVLDEAGLAVAVQTLAETFTGRTGVPVRCDINCSRAHSEAPTLYAVARELLGNVARHAGAGRVDLELRDTGDQLILTVQDDGVGLDPASLAQRLAEGHIGLASHRARIETLGGTLEFLPADRGTLVRATVPARTAP